MLKASLLDPKNQKKESGKKKWFAFFNNHEKTVIQADEMETYRPPVCTVDVPNSKPFKSPVSSPNPHEFVQNRFKS